MSFIQKQISGYKLFKWSMFGYGALASALINSPFEVPASTFSHSFPLT